MEVAEEAKGLFDRDVNETGLYKDFGHVLDVEATFVGDEFKRLAFFVLVDVVDFDHSLVLLVGGMGAGGVGGMVVTVGMVVVTVAVGSIVLGRVVSMSMSVTVLVSVSVSMSMTVTVTVTVIMSIMAMINSSMNMMSLKVRDNHPPTALNNLLSQCVDNSLDIFNMMQHIVGKRHIKAAILSSKIL